ncbi:putative pentatricopeptide repeat-containing protein At3g05240 [Salvia miltiorrhiza]|uniref:putative pentatricopeptide repeat-containing protein At3g05240 n=1 Tax=Salvia miltiorrhiza TaxID=226208 RepID=UPI0025ACEED5|nr:putative pentatricopeptide repeat-containing protein At3g05240 [Salvia miltiorrhiza]
MNYPPQIRLARLLLQEKTSNLLSPLQLFQLHSLAITTGLQFQHPSVLLSLFKLSLSNPSTLTHADKLFPRVQEPYKWNLMIRHASATSPLKALSLFQEMRSDTSSAPFYNDPFVYASLVKACGKARGFLQGKSVHCRVIKLGLGYNANVLNSLVSFYLGSVNLMSYAAVLFDSVSEKNVVIVNGLISGNVRRGNFDLGLKLFVEMLRRCFGSNVKPNCVTFVILISGCVEFGGFATGKALHCCSWKMGFGWNVEMCNALIDFYAKLGFVCDAANVFAEMPERDLISWNSMVWGHVKSGDYVQAFSLFGKMRNGGVGVDGASFSCLLSACAARRDLWSGRMVHARVKAAGMESDVSVGTALINVYAKCRSLKSARKLFDELPKREIGYWNAMIHAYIDAGLAREALKLLDEIKLRGLRLDEVTVLGLIMACRDAGELHRGSLVHSIVESDDLFKGSMVMGNALVDMYAKCGSTSKARSVFERMPRRDVISWTSMIVGHAVNGEGGESLATFKQMCAEKFVPNHVTLLGVLLACDHAGLVDEGMRLYNTMSEVYHIEPRVEHCGCVVDMLARAGRVGDAQMFVQNMHAKPNALVWRMLLNACRVHGHIDLGLIYVTGLAELDTSPDPASFVISSIMYAEAGRWNDVVSSRDIMVVEGASKEAGKSCISYLTE